MEGIELAELIDSLRDELSKARKAGEQEDLRFEVGPVELEVTLGVTKEKGARGGLRFVVFEIGADAKLASATTQRLKLSLMPHGGPLVLAGEAAEGEH